MIGVGKEAMSQTLDLRTMYNAGTLATAFYIRMYIPFEIWVLYTNMSIACNHCDGCWSGPC